MPIQGVVILILFDDYKTFRVSPVLVKIITQRARFLVADIFTQRSEELLEAFLLPSLILRVTYTQNIFQPPLG